MQEKPSPEILKKNLDALHRSHPDLARQLDSGSPVILPELISTKSGHLTVKIQGASGKTYSLHSAYNPLQEADALLEKQLTAGVSAGVLLGFGLGYLFQKLMARMPTVETLLIVEPHLSHFHLALSSADYSEYFSDNRIVWIIDNKEGEISERFQGSLLQYIHSSFFTLKHPPSFRENAGLLRKLEQISSAYNNELLAFEKYPRLRKIFSGESVLKDLDLPRAWQIIENSTLLPTDRERLLFSILYGVWEGG